MVKNKVGRILCIDFGSKRIGLAITDDLRIISSPLDVYPNDSQLFPRLKKLCLDYGVDRIVIGYPYSETHQEALRKAEEFGENLLNELKIDIDFFNEEFSTFFAESTLKSMGIKEKDWKKNIDKYAAQKILSDYLKEQSGS